MASGTFNREDTGNPLEVTALGNNPKTRAALSGIRTGQGSVDTSGSSFLQQATGLLAKGTAALREKERTEDFLQGQMAGMSGETEAQLRERGASRHEMAGLVSIEVGNMMSAWHQEQVIDARNNWSESSPEEYQAHLAKQSANLISQMGGDAFAQKQLTGALAKSVGQLAQAQRVSHQGFVDDSIASEYGHSLSLTASSEVAVTTATAVGPRTNAGYQGYAEGVVGSIIGVESSGNPNAKNPASTAEGLGQIIDETWLGLIKRNRPDLANSYSKAELLAMKTNGALNREMTVAYTRENAAALASAGLAVNPRNSYLMHFAGPGGGKRVIRGDRNAHVSTVLTEGQISANPFLKDWTVGQMQDWAERKMGGAAATSMKDRVLTNPGLSPKRHRAEVLGAILNGFANDDASLFETSGGLETLRELGATNAELATVQKGYRAYKKKEKSAYSMEYERGADAIIALADEGTLSEEEVYQKLQEFQDSHPRTDVEMKRLYEEVTGELKENEDLADQGWNTPEGLKIIVDAEDAMREAGSSEEMQAILEGIVEEGRLMGISPEMTLKQTTSLAKAYQRSQKDKRAEIAKRSKVSAAQRADADEAAQRVAAGTLGGTEDKGVLEAAFKQMQQATVQEIKAQQLDPAQEASAASALYSKKLVASGAVDKELAADMAAGVLPEAIAVWSTDGELPEQAIRSYAQFLDLRRGARASDEYLTRMFQDHPEALMFFRTVEAVDAGNADTSDALRSAARLKTDPVFAKNVAATKEKLLSGEVMDDAVEAVIRESGAMGNRVTRIFGRLMTSAQQDAQADSMANDPSLRNQIETRMNVLAVQYPHAPVDALQKQAIGEVQQNGTALAGTWVKAPSGTTLHGLAGIDPKEGPDALNDAVLDATIKGVQDLPDQVKEYMKLKMGDKFDMEDSEFEQITDSILFGLQGEAASELEAITMMATRTPTRGMVNPENFDFQYVPIDGDMVVRVSPKRAVINRWFGDEEDLDTQGLTFQFTLSDAGKAWNEKDAEVSAGEQGLNALADILMGEGFVPATAEEMQQDRDIRARNALMSNVK